MRLSSILLNLFLSVVKSKVKCNRFLEGETWMTQTSKASTSSPLRDSKDSSLTLIVSKTMIRNRTKQDTDMVSVSSLCSKISPVHNIAIFTHENRKGHV
ncbi:hypothetical protein BX666DRAFT_1900792 [Dichotomocladium elegans]|nr:hypothetical protein BX666DRAFT_1900792 [Dichotomocladium elegans]